MKSLVFKIQIIICLLIFNKTTSLKAQIICTSLNPQLIVSTAHTLNIDLNADLTTDFKIIFNAGLFNNNVTIIGNQVGTLNSVLSDNSNQPMALALNTPIGSTSSAWFQMNTVNAIMLNQFGITAPYGNWVGAVDKYLGLKLVVGANTYYGWARFTFLPNSMQYVFKEYAYNSTPNQSILAGQGCVSSSSISFNLDSPICGTQTTEVTANTGSLSVNGYSWTSSPAGAIFSTPNSSVSTLQFPGPGTYSITLSVNSGSLISSLTKTISVNPFPAIQVVASPTSFCMTHTQTGTISATGAPVFTFISVGSSNNYSVGTSCDFSSSFANTTFSVFAESNNCIHFDTVTVFTENPPAFFTKFVDSLCLGNSVVLTATIPSIYGINWVAPPSNTFAVNVNSVVVTPTVLPFVYTVTIKSQICEVSQEVTLVKKKFLFYLDEAERTICKGNTTTITANPFSFGTPNFQWHPPNMFSPQGSSIVVASPTASGVYSVFGTNSAMCEGTYIFTITVDECVGIESQITHAENFLSIYPNPAKRSCQITWPESLEGKSLKLEIKNMLGAVIYSEKHRGQTNCNINTTNFKPGVYFVALYAGGNLIEEKKLMIEP